MHRFSGLASVLRPGRICNRREIPRRASAALCRDDNENLKAKTLKQDGGLKTAAAKAPSNLIFARRLNFEFLSSKSTETLETIFSLVRYGIFLEAPVHEILFVFLEDIGGQLGFV